MLHDPCILGGGEENASPLPSQGPTRGRKCYVPHAFSGVPRKGDSGEVATSDFVLFLGGTPENGVVT